MKVKMLKETNYKCPGETDEQALKKLGQTYNVPGDVGRRWAGRRPPIAEIIEDNQEENQEPDFQAKFSTGAPVNPFPSINDLKSRAKELGIKKYGNMKKEELIEAINEAEYHLAQEAAATRLNQLRKQASDLRIKGFEEMDGEQLIEAIEKALNNE
jgi:hypothetical protein